MNKKKKYLQLFLLSIVISFVSCKGSTSKEKNDKSKSQVELESINTLSADSLTKIDNTDKSTIDSASTVKQTIYKHYERMFVIARSGLNYCKSPKGEVLGQYPLNTQLKIIEYPKVTDQIMVGEKTTKGEWVGVEWGTDTVYVFNGFLSSSHIVSDIELYTFSEYYEPETGKFISSYLNLSETYFNSSYSENRDRNISLNLTKEDLLQDTFRLSNSQRKNFLKLSNISELDKVFIYNSHNGIITTLNVKDLSVVAAINIYSTGRDIELDEYDFEFGFDMSTYSIGDFAVIGKNNPFHEGKLTPIIWRKINNENFPKKFNADIITDDRKRWFDEYEGAGSFMFTHSNLKYYIQDLKKGDRLKHRYIIVIDSITDKIIYENVQIDSESTYLIPLVTDESDEYYGAQQTGKLFKDKEPVLFGFLGNNFGCPSISVLDKTELPIPILCDNRH